MLRVFIQHFQLAPCSAKGKPVATAPLKTVVFQTTLDSTHSFGGGGRAQQLALPIHSEKGEETELTSLQVKLSRSPTWIALFYESRFRW